VKFLAFFIILCVYFVFIWRWRKNEQSFYPKDRPLVFGHRGSPENITENTIPSFQKAIEEGVDGLEFDVRLTKDKRAVIFHDSDLNRLAGVDKKIKHLTHEELKKINLAKGGNIPLLDDLAPILKDAGVINIEIKSDSLFSGYGVVGPVVKFIEKHSLQERCIVSCFNPLVLIKLKFKRPRIIIGYLYNKNVPLHSWHNVVWMRRVRPDNLHIHYSLLDSWVVRWAKKQGLKINSYTINDSSIYSQAKELKIDGVFTDNIEYIK
jgi:glycerophosphoryl diester phosphodiesterase